MLSGSTPRADGRGEADGPFRGSAGNNFWPKMSAGIDGRRARNPPIGVGGGHTRGLVGTLLGWSRPADHCARRRKNTRPADSEGSLLLAWVFDDGQDQLRFPVSGEVRRTWSEAQD
jgi:hypothetical protein